jgi:GTP pyrophosphokinase
LKDENILRGKELIIAYAKAKGLPYHDFYKTEYQEKVQRKYGFHNWDDCLATIGHGGIKEGQIVNRMYEEYKKDHPVQITDADVLDAVAENKAAPQRPHSKSGIVVKGLYDMAVHFSKCCSPVPGDEIIGFVTRGRGVSVHRTDCINMLNLTDAERVRLIEAEWQTDGIEELGEYFTEIKLFCNDKPGILVEVSRVFAERDINILGLHSRTNKQGVATIEVSFNTKGREQISSLVERLRQIENVIEIQRTTG